MKNEFVLTSRSREAYKKSQDLLDKYWRCPDKHISLLCRQNHLDYSIYMDKFLDFYNDLFRKDYNDKDIGENSTLEAMVEINMKEALWHTWTEMSDECLKRQMSKSKYITPDDWYLYGIGS